MDVCKSRREEEGGGGYMDIAYQPVFGQGTCLKYTCLKSENLISRFFSAVSLSTTEQMNKIFLAKFLKHDKYVG